MKIGEKLIESAKKLAQGKKIKDVRIGLGYSCVELDNGGVGLGWTPEAESGSCTHVKAAGSIAGSDAFELLQWLNSQNPLERALGLATFNALNSERVRANQNKSDSEATSLLNISKEDYVVMVGFFGPVVPKIKEIGCKFDVVELKSDKPGVIGSEKGEIALGKCDVAIITSTSIINGTCDGLLKSLGKPRAAVMLGPSTPMAPDVFKDTPITQLSGSIVSESEEIKKIISEGGGTRLMKKKLEFWSVFSE